MKARPARLARALTACAAALALALGPAAVAEAGGARASVPTIARADQVRDLEYWLADYGFAQAWKTTKGAGVKVAVIDTGVDGSVADLAGAVVGGTDVSGVGAANGQKPLGDGDSADHGTWVASLLAGRGTGPTSGVLGAAPEASILTASVALGKAIGPVSSDDQIAEAIRWAVDNGAKVINMSLTRNTLDWPTSWDDAFQYAFSHDVVVVAAAGNRGSGTTEVGAPATIPGVLTVAGVDRQGKASFDASSQGITIGVSAPATIPGVLTVAGVDRQGKASFDASSQGITIGVSAPSEQLVGVSPGGGYVQWEGTSGAAPLVSGAVALVRAAHPELKAPDVIERIIKTARPAGGSVPSPIYGYGLLDAAAAVTASVPHVTENPMGDLGQWIHIHRRAETPTTPAPGSSSVAAPPPARLAPERSVRFDRLLWPQWGVLTTLWLPVSLIGGFAALAGLGGAGAWLHFRRRAGRE